MGDPLGEQAVVRRPSWKAIRGRKVLPKGREWSGGPLGELAGVKRPSWKAGNNWEALLEGWESSRGLLEGWEWSGDPLEGLVGVGKLSSRSGRVGRPCWRAGCLSKGPWGLGDTVGGREATLKGREGSNSPFGGVVGVRRPSRWAGSVQEVLPEGREWLGGPPEKTGEVWRNGRCWEFLPVGWQGSRGPPRYPAVLERLTQ